MFEMWEWPDRSPMIWAVLGAIYTIDLLYNLKTNVIQAKGSQACLWW